MKNLRRTEELMMLPTRRKNHDYEVAYSKMVEVFRFKDIKDRTNHCEILKLLYGVNKRQFTLNGISSIASISDNALRRHRIEYAEWFKYFLDIERKKIIAS